MMDVSGSMGEFEKYIARTFYFWMVRFLRTKYNNVEIVFITHHTEAKEVDEEDFFTLGESRRHAVSSAYQLALELIERALSTPALEHLPLPLLRRRQLGRRRQPALRAAGRPAHRALQRLRLRRDPGVLLRSATTLMSAFAAIKDERFIPVVIRNKAEVYPALRRFFALREAA